MLTEFSTKAKANRKVILFLMVVLVRLSEVGVGDGYPPEFYNLGVSQGPSLLAALARFIVTDTETSTWNERRMNTKVQAISAVSSS